MQITTDHTPRLGDVDAVAVILDLSSKTVRRMADAGKIPGVIRLGRLLRFDLTVLSQWIQQGCPPAHRFRPNAPAGEAASQPK